MIKLNGIGTSLKYLRSKHKISQKQLAEKLNIHQTMVSKFERNIQIPSDKIIKRIERFFNEPLRREF